MTEKMSAWLEEVGRAATNVMRSQMIAPMSAATTLSCVTTFGSTMPLPTAFAASWNPLTNSNASPRSTTSASRTVALSKLAVLHHDGLDDVGDVLAAVD